MKTATDTAGRPSSCRLRVTLPNMRIVGVAAGSIIATIITGPHPSQLWYPECGARIHAGHPGIAMPALAMLGAICTTHAQASAASATSAAAVTRAVPAF